MQVLLGLVLILTPALGVFLSALLIIRRRERLRLEGEGLEFERLRRMLS